MPGNGHVRFGGRAEETDRWKRRHRASVRPYPARADKHLGYVHVAATEWLTAMHTGGRSKVDIDDGGILPGYPGTVVRDGYAGYTHLTDALHAWCGAHYPDLRIIPTSARRPW